MRYAGFGPRLGAMLVDFVVLMPVLALSFWSLFASHAVAVWMQAPVTLLFAFYQIFFVGRWGQTLGKMALRIKVVALDGSDAGYRRAFYRHAVDLFYSFFTTAMMLSALLAIPAEAFDAAGLEQKLVLLGGQTVQWTQVFDVLYWIWTLSELVVLLTNEKRRALHDFIAGTVVVHR
jgi:uncharacterized RDD family membrane protein YckC